VLAVHRTSRGLSKPGWDTRSRVASLLERPEYLRSRLLAADAILAPTRFLKSVFVANGVPEGRIAARGYGIDPTGIAANPTAAGAQQRPLTFGFFGTFAPHKAPHMLVAAMTHVRGDCRVILRGRTSDFAEYSAALTADAARDPRIAVLPPYDRDALPQALAAIDVLVVPSTWHENAPFVVLEARAAGLPVLASRFGGLAEVVADGVDGELFAPGDAADLAMRMQRLCDEPERLAAYRRAVTPPKTLATAVDEFESTYREVLRA
jgi:glycosyltransferase involved in cell wall biosynthesis